MSNYRELLEKIREYSKGRSDFIYGLNNLNFYNKVAIGRGMYILVGGQAGSGKTSFVDTALVLNIFQSRMMSDEPIPLWLYNSLERHKDMKIAKWSALVCYWGGHMLDVPTILNLPNKKRDLTSKDFEFLERAADLMEEIEKSVIFYGGPITAQQIKDNCIKVAKGRGKYITTEGGSIKVNGVEVGKFGDDFVEVRGAKRRVFRGSIPVVEGETYYIPNDEKEIVITITDHIGKVNGMHGANTKKTIDEHANNQAFVRDILKWCPVDISQFNRENQGTTRNLKMDLDVKEADFKNSSTPYENSDLVLGLINPHKLGHARYTNSDGTWNVRKMISPTGENRLRVLKIVKNSYGSDDMQMPLLFLGENGFIDDLPLEMESFSERYNYESIQNIRV
jgi:hypothetical protein